MDQEVIAIMPKRSATGLMLFIIPEPTPNADTDDLDEVEVAKTKIPETMKCGFP